ncbi:hypothetical protein LINPERPRIM_LOCUS13829 [Linum perenne]
MYPRVKVRMVDLQDEDDELYPPLTNSKKEARPFKSSIAEKENNHGCDSSPLLVARVVLQNTPQSVSSNKGSKKPTVHPRSTAVLRPRAVLSSPDNDNLIGKRNKLIDSRSSPGSGSSRKINFSGSSKIVTPVCRPKALTSTNSPKAKPQVTSTKTTISASKPTSINNAVAKKKKQQQQQELTNL